MDEVVERYERGNELIKGGRTDEAVAEWRAGLAVLERVGGQDLQQRGHYFLTKLAVTLWNQGRYDESRRYYEMMGQAMPKPPTNRLPFDRALKAMHSMGLMLDANDDWLNEYLEENGFDEDGQDEDFELIDVVLAYYSEEPGAHLTPRAVQDGFLYHDWRFGQETDDVVGELNKLSGLALSVPIDLNNVQSLDEVIAAYNLQLAGGGDKRRFVALETNGDWHGYFLVEAPTYKKLFAAKSPALAVQSVPGLAVGALKNWLQS